MLHVVTTRGRAHTLVDCPNLLADPARLCAEGIRGTGGGVPSKTGILIGLLGVLTGAGILDGGKLASATPSDDRRADRRMPGVDDDTLIANG